MNYRATKGVALAALLTTASVTGVLSGQAWADDATGRIDQLEARVLKLEAASHEQSGMMKHMMKHSQSMPEKNMGSPMGTMPPTAPPMSPAGATPAPGMGGHM